MAHEITEVDGVVLHARPAWHGLGVVVTDAPTPDEALKLAGLDWEVEQWPLSATNGETRLMVDDRMNVRMPGAIRLGIVSAGYKVLQNRQLAQFCNELAEVGDTVRVESAGSIRQGRKVWFLLKGESFSVRAADMVEPYILVSNGHDGGTAIRATPTTIRVVCSNTLHMVIPRDDRGGCIKVAGFAAAHVGNATKRIEEAKAILGLYGRALDGTRAMVDELAARDVSNEAANRFWLECYTATVGSFADVPTTTRERTERDRAVEAMRSMSITFQRERDLAGPTAWNAANAFSRWIQQEKRIHAKDLGKKRDARLQSNLFGVNQEATNEAMQRALSM